jgi:hypothetical protein
MLQVKKTNCSIFAIELLVIYLIGGITILSAQAVIVRRGAEKMLKLMRKVRYPKKLELRIPIHLIQVFLEAYSSVYKPFFYFL